MIAVSRAAFCDEAFEARERPALTCLGIERVDLVRPKMRSAYIKFDDKAGFGRFDDTDLVFIDGNYVYAEYGDTAERRMKLVPPHNYGPPERCYYTTVTDNPGFVVNPFGEDAPIHIPWEPGALYHRQGYTNTLDFA